ncbi:MAG TPA: hypothetical protein VKB52_12310 [Rhodanobacteraceae bacterium]|nr:hypothetical protein [Rhodanobacteraceae bacterium]
MSRTLCMAALVLASPFGLAADGDVDRSFGDAGQVTIARPPGAPTSPTPTGDVLALADGAYLWSISNEDASLWIGRTLHDGSPDTAYGSDGSGHVTLTECIDFMPTFLASDGDGGAYAWTGACLVRILADGSVDATFGGVPIVGDAYAVIDFARDASGRFVLAATTGITWDLFRFDTDGVTPDATFGTDGHVRIDVTATNNLRGINAIAVRGDGRIVAAGWRGNDHGPNLVVAELTESGDFDPSWNGGAVVDLDPPQDLAGIEATALALDADGSIVVGGFGAAGRVGCCLLLTRLDTTGAVVEDFGVRIFDLVDVSLGTFFEGRDQVTIRRDGSILLATTAFPFSPEHRTQFWLTHTDANGVLDTAFGDGGWRGYTIDDPSNSGQTGDYVQLHAIAPRDDSVLLFGRTFFEDNSNGLDYVSMVRALFAPPDTLFANGFD